MKKLHFIAWERAREKGALRCTGKNERKKVALRCSGQSGRESCAGQGKRATPGGCECHRETGSARLHSQPPKLRMPPRDWLRPVAANATERLHKNLEICCCDNFFLWTCVPKPRPSLWVEVDFHLIRGFLEVANFESRIPRKLTRNHCRIPRGCKF